MKFINKLLLVISLFLVVSSCEELTELDLLNNPNAASPDQANINDLYNNIQLEFRNIFNNSVNYGANLARQIAPTGAEFTYQEYVSPTTFDGIWNNFYADFLPDIRALEDIAAERGLDIHSGTAKIMQAYALMLMVDMFGDIPYSQAGQGTDVISPTADMGSDIYAQATQLLDDAATQLSNTNAAAPNSDVFYNGDPSKWITLANTLKLRMAVTTRLVNGNAASEINTLIGNGDLIDSEDEDFQWQYNTQRANPNSRHPNYNNSYEANDGTYQNNWFMWLMYTDKEDMIDPRMRLYFYRQDIDVTSADNDGSEFSCVFLDGVIPTEENIDNTRPAYYSAIDPDMPFCSAIPDRGYHGRDHLNAQGIPPDGVLRTVYGLYPAGGKFDDNSGDKSSVQNLGTDGALGAGINPILLSSFVDFMRAEAALELETNDDPRTMLESAVRKSLDKVIGFAGKVDLSNVVGQDLDGNPVTAEQAFLPDEKDKDDYVAAVLAQYDAAADDDARLNVIMKEYQIALYGNGIEAYNAYRRTGKPEKIQPPLQGAGVAGAFRLSATYPADYVNLNQNATQKADQSVSVFWDNQSADVY